MEGQQEMARQSRPDVAGAKPAVLSSRVTCPLLLVWAAPRGKRWLQEPCGVVGRSALVPLNCGCLDQPPFVDSSVENLFEPLLQGLRVGILVPTSPGQWKSGVTVDDIVIVLGARSPCWIHGYNI